MSKATPVLAHRAASQAQQAAGSTNDQDAGLITICLLGGNVEGGTFPDLAAMSHHGSAKKPTSIDAPLDRQ
ncbi:hypothetical protein I3J13_22725 [Agrobacterium sp. MOPV5]|uniref:hypothetical protein n=1 Tax=Agrobacterium leguminum TaxID=2792015 RepID=UPI0018C1E7A3|nr:hypothetical protein [Agrobacterium leguminum]MBG0511600.1 hypothetical protein [Agrobacterium leguminum]